MFIEWMTRNIEAERLFLSRQKLNPRPGFRLRQIVRLAVAGVVETAEQIVLSLGLTALRPGRSRQRRFERVMAAGAPGEQVHLIKFQGIKRPGTDQTFQHAPVYRGRVNSLGEVIKRSEGSRVAR